MPRTPTPAQREAARRSIRLAAAAHHARLAAMRAGDMTDPGLTEAETEEALAMLRAGKEALDLRDWFGGGSGWWRAWVEMNAVGRVVA